MLENSATPSHAAELTVEIDRVSFRNDDNGWTVLKATNMHNLEALTATGYLPEVCAGQRMQILGKWQQHKTYGPQFLIERSTFIRPQTTDAILKFLSSGAVHGIGPKTAEKMIKAFGVQTLDVLDNEPERLLKLKSIGRKKAQAIIDTWHENRTINDVMIFLQTHGISQTFAGRIFKLYREEAIAVVTRDPYRLAVDIHGIGFIKSDQIARQLGIAADSPERIRAGILYLLGQAEDRGDCFLTTPQLYQELKRALEIDEQQLQPKFIDCLSMLEKAGSIISEKSQSSGEVAYFRAELLMAELSLTDGIRRLMSEPLKVEHQRIEDWISRYVEASGTQLSEQQLEAVRMAASSKVFILTGGPGVGKTTTANAIIRLLRAMGRNVALCAPTGRAAQRLSEVSSMQAKTIHRLLEWQPNSSGFVRNEYQPLEVQCVIADESSMLDIRLADALVRAVPTSAQLILIGDVDQLPSVGPGNVLSDLIRSRTIPFIKLDRIFRQAKTSSIIQIAHQMNRGEYPEFAQSPLNDCQFIDHDTPESIIGCVKELLVEGKIQSYGLDPVRDVQILTPMNRGPLGTHELNLLLQSLLNPLRKGMTEYKRQNFTLRPGDKVIQSANNYELGVFNGDIGYVQLTQVDDGKIIVRFGERQIAYDSDSAADLRLAYAITIHKSQGSEFPAVIIPTSTQHFVMLQRNLFYTGLTRAKRLAIFVGTQRALRTAIDNNSSRQRQTRVCERLARG
jgi:exodeoxyribonuclease V alpha subunit